MQFTFQQAGTGGKRKSKLPTAEEYARYLAAGDTDVRKPPSAKGYADYLQTREGQAGRDRDAYDSRVRQSYKERRLAAEEAEKAANIVQAGDKTFTISKNFLPGGQLGELRQEDISAREKEKARREEQLDALSKKRGEGVSFLDKGEMEEIGETADAYFRKAPLNTGKRIWYGAGNIGKTMTGAAPLIAETADAAREEAAASRRKRENDPDYARYYGQLSETLARLEALRDEVRQSDKPAGETEEEIARLEGDVNRLEGILREKGEAYAPVLPDTWGMERLREARGDAEKALEGLSPGGQFLGSAALSVGQNLALMPTAVINPALPLAGMGVLSAADKMFGLNERGVRPGEALFRGAVSGGIEALTEKIPLDSVIDMVKAGGRGFVKNMLRQAGTEATEEGISYALNYIADKAARDPEASFSVAELLESAAAGGLSGLFFGLGGTALGRVTGSAQGRAGTVATAGETQTAAGGYPGMAAANAGQSALSGQNNTAPTEGTVQITSDENLARYAREVAGVFTGDLPERSMVAVGETPEVLTALGANPLQITMTQDTARKIAYPEGYLGGKHNLGIPALKQLPTQIADPVAVLKSTTQPNSLVLLTAWEDTNGNPVIVPLHLDKQGAVTVENRVASAYGKGDMSAVLGRNNENVLYTKNNEDIHQLIASRLQLPTATADDILGNSIPPMAENSQGVNAAGRIDAELAERLPAYEKLLSGRALSESEAARIQEDEGAMAALRAKGYAIEGSPAEQRQTIKAIARGEIAPQRGGDASMSAWRYEDMERPAGEENAAERAEKAKAALMEEAAGPDAPDFESVESPVYYGGTWESVRRTTGSGKRLGVEAGRVRRVAELSHALRVPVEFYRGGGEHGYYEGGVIHLNAGSDHPAADVFFHELTHHAEQGEKSYTKFLRELTNSKTMAKWLKENGITMQDLEAAVKEQQPGLDDIGIDREIAALFAEKYLFKDDGAINSLARSDKGLFSRVRNYVSYLVQKLTGSSFENEIRKLERLYGKAYRAAQKAGTHTDTGRKYSISEPLLLQLRQWLSGQMAADDYFRLGVTPKSLQKHGAQPLPIIMTQDVITKITNGYHSIAIDEIARLPSQLARPVMIFQGSVPNSLVVLTEMVDKYGDEIIGAIHLNKYQKRMAVNRIASLYGKQNIENYIQRNIEQGNLLDVDKEKAPEWFTNRGLQLPKLVQTTIDANTSKAQDSTGVNGYDMSSGKKDAQKSVKSPDEIIRIAAERRALLPKEAQEGADMDSAFAESIQKSKIFSPDFIAKAEADPRITRYKSVANEEVMAEAAADIAKSGDKAVYIFMNKPPAAATAKDVAKGFILLHRFQAAGEYEAAIAVTQKLREMGTAAGQTVQIYSILGRLTPEGMTMYAQRELDALYERLKMIKTEGWLRANKEKFRLTAEDMDFIRARVEKAARLPEGRDKNILLAEICSRVQAKIPPTKSKSLKAWVRVSLLLNPRTNVRNVLGNAVIMPMHAVSDFIGAGLDKAISAKTGVRTTGMYDPRSVKGMAKGAYESYDDFRRKINTRDLSGDRFEIGEGPSFKTDWNGDRFGAAGRGAAVLGNAMGRGLNALDRTTSFLLDLGDRPFYEMWFANSLNNQMKLNGASEATAEMIDIARQEALERTWQDNNAMTRSLTKFRDGLNEISGVFHVGGKEFGLGNLVFTFTKTPANLTKAMIEFSPLGLGYALSNEAQRFYSAVKYGTATPQMQKSFVSHMGKATAGSIAFASFILLAAAGVITGAGDEDRDAAAFQKDVMGVRPYSIKIGNTTYTYDWAQPVGGLMAAAADIVRSWEEMDGGDKFDRTAGLAASAILNALAAGGNSGFKQSVYTGLSELFSSDDIMQGLIEVAVNLPAMMTPTLLQQIAQMGDPVARTSYEKGNPVGTMVNQVKAKIPGLRQTLAPQVDVLGREVAAKTDIFNVMLNPANQSAATPTEASKEIWDLYEKTGNNELFPRKAAYTYEKDGEKTDMTSHERAAYQKTMGQTSAEIIGELVRDSYYSLLPDEEKAAILKSVYDYGSYRAKKEIGADIGEKMSPEKKAEMAEGMDISPALFYRYIKTAGTDDRPLQEEAEEAIDAMDLTMEQKAYLWALTNAGWSSKSNPYKRRYKIEGFTKR